MQNFYKNPKIAEAFETTASDSSPWLDFKKEPVFSDLTVTTGIES